MPSGCQPPKNLASLKKGLAPFLSEKIAVVVAYSGGLDSHVLLHLCATLKVNLVRAIHIHHGLNSEADFWASHCEETCQQLSVPFSLIQVDAKPRKGESREEAARDARYDALKSHLQKGELLLTAQHREDQAETLLLQLFRGCGVKGLAAMPVSMQFGRGQLVRPLLDCSQSTLRDYASAHKLHWIEDSSNQDQSFDRNYLRQSIMPLLENRWPTISGRLARTSSHCGEASSLLNGMADRLLHELISADGESLLIDRVLDLSDAQKRLILRRWIDSQKGRPPSQRLLKEIIQNVLTASIDAMPSVHWSGFSIRRYRNQLYFMSESVEPVRESCLSWDVREANITIGRYGELTARITPAVGVSAKLWNKGPVTIHFRRGGERLKPIGRSGTHQLKKLFQEAGIPPWIRKKIPLVYINNQLAVVSGLWIADWCKGEGLGEDILLSFLEAAHYRNSNNII